MKINGWEIMALFQANFLGDTSCPISFAAPFQNNIVNRAL